MIFELPLATLVDSNGSSPDHASTDPFSRAVLPAACCKFCRLTVEILTPALARDCRRKKYGSVPLVTAIDLPASCFTELIGDPTGTRMADQSGCEKTSMALIGEPFARARSAAEPAVEPTSTTPARSAWLAVFDPLD